MKTICLLINPRSGKGNIRQHLYSIVELFHKEGWLTTVIPVAIEPDMVVQLGEQIETFDLVVCCGGDGTLNHTADTLLQCKNPPIAAYLPMGSTNDFASTLNYSNNFLDNCKTAIQGKQAALDLGMFCKEKLFCYIAAFGAFTAVSYSTPQELKNNLGHTAYLLESLKHLPINTSIHAVITTEQDVIEGDFIYGSFSNSTSVGGFPSPIGKDVVLNDGKFELLLISAPKNLNDFNSLIGCLAQQNFSNPYIRLIQCKTVKVQFDEPVSFTLDGEYGGTVTEAQMDVLPKVLNMNLPLKAPLE